MSLFSGFSTAIDEERAIRLSKLVTEKAMRLMARALQLHRPVWPKASVDMYAAPDSGPKRHCAECGKTWPCPTTLILTNAGEDEP